MSKKAQTPQEWQPEIDREYEQRVTALTHMEHQPAAVTPVRRVTEADREEFGLTRPQRQTYVPAPTQHTSRAMSAPEMAALNQVSHALDVAPTATQHIEVKTSSVDRALGHLIISSPMHLLGALAITLVAIYFQVTPFLSLATLIIFVLTLTFAHIVTYLLTLQHSAEGIARYESRRKWDVIANEQRERWNYYRSLNDGR